MTGAGAFIFECYRDTNVNRLSPKGGIILQGGLTAAKELARAMPCLPQARGDTRFRFRLPLIEP